jgi:hypothetical protein
VLVYVVFIRGYRLLEIHQVGDLMARKEELFIPRRYDAASLQPGLAFEGYKHYWQAPQVLGVKLERLVASRQKLTFPCKVQLEI